MYTKFLTYANMRKINQFIVIVKTFGPTSVTTTLASALPAVQIRFVESMRVAHCKERSEERTKRKAMRCLEKSGKDSSLANLWRI